MQYISPVSLLQTLVPGPADKKSYALAKKKLLAELELNGGDTITINSQALTKNDIIGFFDTLQQEDNLAYHMIIAGNAVLLRFLEYNVIERGNSFDREELHNNPLFIEWVSPYFFQSFSSFAAKCLANKDDGGWMALSSNPVLLNSWYLEEAWGLIEATVRKDLANLYSFIKSNGAPGINFIKTITDTRYASILQQLPANRFTALRDEYGYMMMQCSIGIFNRFSKPVAVELIENAWRVAVSRDLKDKIQGRQAEMDHVARNENEARKAGGWIISSSTWRIIIVALLIALKFATCVSNM